MKKQKSPAAGKTGIKWPTAAAVKERKDMHAAKGAIRASRERAAQVKQLIAADAATRLPMPTTAALSKEIAEAYGDKSLIAGSPEALEHKEKYNKDNTAWDEVNNIRDHIKGMIAIPTRLAPLVSGDIVRSIPPLEQRVFNRVCKALAADATELIQLINDLSARHEGKSGRAPNFEEQDAGRQLFSEYVGVFELWQHATLPLVDHFCMLMQSGMSAFELSNPPAARELSVRINALLDVMHKDMAKYNAMVG